jgi:hypothetical protein
MRFRTMVKGGVLTLALVVCGCAPASPSVPTTPAPPAVQAATPGSRPDLQPPLPEGALTPVTRRTAGSVTLRTFTQPSPISSCDSLNESCPPAWCAPTAWFITELSTDAIAAVQTEAAIGLDPGSRISVLGPVSNAAALTAQNGIARGSALYGPGSPILGSAEGGPVHLETVRVAPDVAVVRLTTENGEDSTAPVDGLAALAVPGSSTTGKLTAVDSRGRDIAEVSLPASPTAAGAACQAQPPAVPAPGKPPTDAGAAERQVRAAFTTAFTHAPAGRPDAALDAVEGGDSLHGALDQLRKNFPQAVDTATVTTGRLVFTSPTTAVVEFTLTYSGGAPYGTKNGSAVVRGGHWLVSRSTYCMVLGFGGASCPAG